VADREPVLDAAVLDELRATVGDDVEFMADLVETYVRETTGHLDAMSSAAADADAASIVRPAHTLKSSSAALGALRLAQIAREIEVTGRAGSTETLATQVEEASAVWQETYGALTTAGLTR